MRVLHRSIMLFAVVFLLYIGVSGTIIQSIDLTNILSDAPETAPTMESIQDGLTGPPNFQVRSDEDYMAAAFPSAFDPRPMFATVAGAARTAVGGQALDYIELRIADGKVVGRVQSEGHTITFDAATGALLRTQPAAKIAMNQSPGGVRDTVKDLHRMSVFFGGWAMWFQLASAVALLSLATTGLVLYYKLLRTRLHSGRPGLFWSAGGNWRTLHRAVSVLASLFLLVVGVSGSFLAIDNIGGSFYIKKHGLGMPGPDNRADPLMMSAASPIVDQNLLSMLNITLAGFKRDWGETPIKVIRLRSYGNMPQGVVITGGKETRQLVFDAVTGAHAAMTEKGYPETPFPFGWEWHELIKQIHRGSFIGLTGRWMDLLSGLSLVFLAGSGLVMYVTMWTRRRAAGKSALLWK